MTACATACACTARDIIDMYEETRAEGFGAEVKRRILIGTYVLSAGYYDAYYLKAQKVRTLIKRDFDAGLREGRRPADAGHAVAPPSRSATSRPIRWRCTCNDIFTVTVNMAGLPGIRVPGGPRREGPAARPAADRPAVRRGDAVLRARQVIEDADGRMPKPSRGGANDERRTTAPRRRGVRADAEEVGLVVPDWRALRRAARSRTASSGIKQHGTSVKRTTVESMDRGAGRDRPHRRSADRSRGRALRLCRPGVAAASNNPAEATVPWRIRQVIDKVEARGERARFAPGTGRRPLASDDSVGLFSTKKSSWLRRARRGERLDDRSCGRGRHAAAAPPRAGREGRRLLAA